MATPAVPVVNVRPRLRLICWDRAPCAKPGISPTDYEVSSQFAHFFTAAFLVSELGRFGRWELYAALAGMIVFAAIKEFWYDETHENPLVRGSSPLDFCMYTAGAFLGFGLSFVR